jgi:hypothetical protein
MAAYRQTGPQAIEDQRAKALRHRRCVADSDVSSLRPAGKTRDYAGRGEQWCVLGAYWE